MDKLRKLPGALLPWYQKNKRDLPWRQDREPYHVWLSEIMLQQTRVEAVKGYYARFLESLPTIEALANCDDDKLHKQRNAPIGVQRMCDPVDEIGEGNACQKLQLNEENHSHAKGKAFFLSVADLFEGLSCFHSFTTLYPTPRIVTILKSRLSLKRSLSLPM